MRSNAFSPGSQHSNFDLKIGSFNIQGQANRSLLKLRKIKQIFDKAKFDIFLLQEIRTDGSQKEIKKWSKIFDTNHIFFTEHGSESVGAGIIIRNNNKFRVDNVIKDPLGRFISVLGDHEEGRFLITCMYCPSQNNVIKLFTNEDISNIFSPLELHNKIMYQSLGYWL